MNHSLFRGLILLMIFACAARAAQAGELGGLPPLERTLRLDLWGVGLDETAQAIRAQTGVEILFYRADIPADALNAGDVYLVTGNVTLGTVMEVLARRFAFRFRATAAGKVEISRGYGWVGTNPALRFVRIDPLVENGMNSAAFQDILAEFTKPLPLLTGEFVTRFEKYPLPERPDAQRGALVLPAVLADYLARGLRCLAGDAGDYPPETPTPGRDLFAAARGCLFDWESLLTRTIRTPKSRDLRSIATEIAQQAGVALCVRSLPDRDGHGLPAEAERSTLGRLCELTASSWNLGKRVFLCSGGVVFDGGESDIETDARTRELYWDGLAVAGFDVGKAVERARGPDGLRALLRRDIFPGLWRDPVCVMAYSPLRKRLAVVAPANVLAALAERIRELE